MYITYVDESGDIGLINSPTRYFILSALVIHELRWRDFLNDTLMFRRALKQKYGFKVRQEIHSAPMIRGNGDYAKIKKSLRLQILKEVIEWQARNSDLRIVNIVVDKQGKQSQYDVFEKSWEALIQRIQNTITCANFPGPKNQRNMGIIVADQTDVDKLRKLSRKMSQYNPVPNTGGAGYRQLPISSIIKDPIHRKSEDSILVQLADVNAYFLKQTLEPNSYVKKKGGKNYFNKLDPILLKVASRTDPMGIVRL